MKKNQILLKITLGVCVFVCILTIFDFLVLHDIQNEDVNTRILNQLNVTLSGDLPEWTATKGEWDIVYVSFLSRLFFFILNIFVLSLYIKKKRKDTQ